MVEHIQWALNSLIQSGHFHAQEPVSGALWKKIGELGVSSVKYFGPAKKALKKGARRGVIASTTVHLNGPVGRGNNILGVLEAGQGVEKLRRELAGVVLHHDGKGNYRLTVLREENPGFNESIQSLQEWWKTTHLNH
ncbi:MAG: hypothetical protein Q8P02_04210 [Candidatus Micrarchaeota archaeon]|nr:hypothetical protein [Candidatus Micrarchaeota archaeon]